MTSSSKPSLVSTLEVRLRETQPKLQQPLKANSTFYRNLEEVLNVRRSSGLYYSIVQNSWQTGETLDFCSGDILGLGRSDARRAEFLAEFTRHPDFPLGSSGVRLMDGNSDYLEQAERDVAAFHGVEDAIMVGSAYEANIAVWTALPRPGDVVIYDALVHASTHEGLKQSLALDKYEFAHNSLDSFSAVLSQVLESNRLIRQGKRSILIAVESIYSMDGDVCPLAEFIEIADELSNGQGNIQFVVDEAHSLGVVGPNGAGLVCELGLQNKIAIVVHSYGKAMGATGAIILGDKTTKAALANFSRSIIYTTAPSFPFIAAIKSGYTLLADSHTGQAREHIQNLARLFFETLTNHDIWTTALSRGLLRVPIAEGWEDRPFLTHIAPIMTGQNYTWWLYFHLLSRGFCVFPVEHPIVPLGQGRLRIILHAFNTENQVRDLVQEVFTWVEEMISIEDGKAGEIVSQAAREVYSWMRDHSLSGYGMI